MSRIGIHGRRAYVRIASAVALLSLVSCAPADDGETPRLRGDYLGQAPPGKEPRLFAPGIVSTGLSQRDTALSPGGERLLYTLWGQNRGALIELSRDDDVWSGPRIASFSGRYSDIEPHFDPSGGRLYFASQRPLPGETEPGDWNLWSVAVEQDGWGTPRPLEGVNGDGGEYYPSVTREGTLYFTAELEDSVGGEDIYRAYPDGDRFGRPRSLGPAVNSPGPDFNAFIAPDESYLILGSVRDGDEGGGDLYVSFRDEQDDWTRAVPMGPRLNSPALDYCPFVSHDGRRLFFSSKRTRLADSPVRRDWVELIQELEGPMNGAGAIYWVDAAIIEDLRRDQRLP